MRGLRWLLAAGFCLAACSAIDVTFEHDPFPTTGGTGGTGGEGGTGGDSTTGFGGTLVSMAGQAGELGMAGQGGEEPMETGPCAGLDEGDDCDDGDPCTEDDVCDEEGECAGTEKLCDDENECTVDGCDPEDGQCLADPVEDGTPCGDDTVENCNAADACIEGVCDEQIGPDGALCDDGDPQTGADVCTGLSCAGVPACADGTAEDVFENNMVGCAGSVAYADRATLCGEGLTPCTAQEWIARRGEGIPTHTYWTNQPLQYGGNANACLALVAGGLTCPDPASPMRICMPGDPGYGSTDPEGNTCLWTNCGFVSATPNEYFGGCSSQDPTAGTLCCW